MNPQVEDQEVQTSIDELRADIHQFLDAREKLKKYIERFEKSKHLLIEEKAALKKEKEKLRTQIVQIAKERQMGYPTLAKAYEEFFELQDKKVVEFIKYKAHAAVVSSKVISEYAKQRREADRERRILQYLIDYYESIAPFLIDLREEVEDIREEDKLSYADYSEEELEDATTGFLTKEEYRKLPVTERNQRALDRYWDRPKSKWQVGKMYERYIGYLYEQDGYDVEYIGIFKGFEDLGRDIIARKDDEIVIAQCKNWSRFKTIYEKHIFQFFGTVFQYKDENKSSKVKAQFYTTTKVSALARRFAKELGIELFEDFKMDKKYPCIKCNKSMVDGTKIYHLPFDQQYDKVKVHKKRGEFYCTSVKEAEASGFRRAFRFKGLSGTGNNSVIV